MTPVIPATEPTIVVPREAEVDPKRELREFTEAIRADSRNAPEEYLREVRVTCGAE